MHSLAAITPLGDIVSCVDIYCGLTITENPDRALASLTARLGEEAALSRAAKGFLGVELPSVGQTSGLNDLHAFWTGPDQWMIDAPFDSHEMLADMLKNAVGDKGSVTEQTDGWCRFDLVGSRVPDVLERLCNLDSRIMGAGSISRSQIEHTGCFVWCRTAGENFGIIGPRSSALSLHHALNTAARSVI